MVKAWFFDEKIANPREPCQLENVSLEVVEALGCKLFKFDAENKEDCISLKKIVKDQNYNFQDEITVSREKLPEYEKKVKMFLEEHIHDDPEARACLDGSGYFDVRDKNDKWIRILVEKGDLLIVPAGIYHRFVPDLNDFIVAIRFFEGNPVWTPINRANEENIEKMPIRQKFLATLL
ncbi:unnamed protein product [Oikopleura dioica]|uniref:Acireductone dioxygenase n=1 Tax=Oikopleura dioica TaxID=34765 RepID=E4XR32_OIKDI|nr:unnamed protein product [Oikopleura dioica]